MITLLSLYSYPSFTSLTTVASSRENASINNSVSMLSGFSFNKAQNHSDISITITGSNVQKHTDSSAITNYVQNATNDSTIPK